MFNFLGNHKIGIIGDANSGKTVLLTSMLWNLEANNLALGEKRAKPTSIEVCKLKKRASAHSFNYEDNKLKLKRKNDWPAKTVGDYSLAQCAYDLPGLSLRHKVTFVDIPGERLADVAIWENSSYSDWSEILLNQWKSSEIYTECLADFMSLLDNPKATWEQLIWSFKCGMRNLEYKYVCQISPSTLFFDQGKLVSEAELADDTWLQERSIWQGGDFFPLPRDWKENKAIYSECEKHYKAYRKNVIHPIFSQIGSCDNFIYCVDLFAILVSGPPAFTRTQEEIQSFVNKVVPGTLKYFFKGKLGGNPRKIAFVATKSDMVYGDNLEKLEDLLKDLTQRFDQGKKLPFGYFVCTAWKSTKLSETGVPVGRIDDDQWAELVTRDLPEAFPEDWKPEDFQYLATPIKPAKAGAKPPRQSGLDEILTFVTA